MFGGILIWQHDYFVRYYSRITNYGLHAFTGSTIMLHFNKQWREPAKR